MKLEYALAYYLDALIECQTVFKSKMHDDDYKKLELITNELIMIIENEQRIAMSVVDSAAIV